MSLLDSPVADIASHVQSGKVSAEALTEECLDRIERQTALGAFITVGRDEALDSAREIDARRRRGDALGPLAGVPVAVKDALCTERLPTTCASRILVRDAQGTAARAWKPPFNATAVDRLLAADAVLVGKTNMDEFAMGSSNENSAFGPARNPWDPTRTPGGSSGGSAASVAARLVPGALGSDTGGSIRLPAGLCGVVGVKPSYGRVSRYGLVAFASSLDQVGPLSRDVRSAARLLDVIAGPDPRDSTTASRPAGGYEAACDRGVRGLRLGIPKEYFAEGLDGEVRASVRAAIDTLAECGCAIEPVDMPHTHHGVAVYYLVATAEASSNLARFDGVRFGLRVEPHDGDLAAMYGATRDAGFGPEVKRRIMLGTYALSAGYYDAYYKKAQQVRTLIRQDFDRAFERVDVLVTPISPTPAFMLGEKVDDPLQMYLSDVYTLPASLAGVCGVSVPCAMTKPTASRPALPVGLQLLAPAFEEARLFSAAAAWEARSPSRDLSPPL